MRAALLAPAVLALCALLACSGGGGDGDAGTDGAALLDLTPPPADVPPDIPPIDPCGPPACGPVELCGAVSGDGGVGEGNGLDDDCDGEVDEGCRCVMDTRHACFPGSADRLDIGPCRAGSALCGELGTWQACAGAVVPAPEVCDGVDNDCDGRADEDLVGCDTAVRCPGFASARPLTEYVADGRAIAAGARAYRWAVECPRGVAPCPAPSAPDAPELRVRVLQSGRYLVRLAVTRADGAATACAWPLYVQTGGLRVEMDWDTKGGIESSGVDMDLHVAPLDDQRPTASRWFTTEDCYFLTCTAPGGRVDWRRGPADPRFAPTTDVSACSGAPPPHGATWRDAGRCWNPRLDIDDITCDPRVTDPTSRAFCFPENINVDVAPQDVTFRILVNFYRDHGTCTDADARNDVTHPRLRIFCAGVVRAELGDVETGEVPFACRDNPGIGSTNWSWLAADVRFRTNACGLEDCAVRPLRDASGRLPLCSRVTADDDVCRDPYGHVLVRRTGSRPIDADVASTL